MREVDNVILAALGTTGVDIHDSYVEVDAQTKAVNYPLPFAVYYSSVGDDANPRLSGQSGRRSVYFRLVYVGVDRNQAKWAGERIRDTLHEKRFAFPGRKSWFCVCETSQQVRRDDDAIRPDGSPLFYGVDEYAVSVTRTPA